MSWENAAVNVLAGLCAAFASSEHGFVMAVRLKLEEMSVLLAKFKHVLPWKIPVKRNPTSKTMAQAAPKSPV